MIDPNTEIVLDVQAPYVLHLYESCSIMEAHADDGSIQRYPVSLEALAERLGRLSLNSGILPRDTLAYCRKNGHDVIVRYFKPEILTFAYYTVDDTVTHFTIPTPPLVWCGDDTEYSLHALNTLEWPTYDTVLYHAPFPNLYTDGTVCWGNTGTPLEASMVAMPLMWIRFIQSGFVDHVVSNRSYRHGDSVVRLWRELHEAQAQTYPLQDLMITERTLGDLIDKR